MRSSLTSCILLAAATALVAAFTAGCGGGGGSGGGPAVEVLRMQQPPAFGVLNANGMMTMPFNINTPSPQTRVGPNDFPAPVSGDRHFIEIQFGTDLDATSIFDGTFSGNDGIVIQDSTGQNIRYFLDEFGNNDPTNAFPAPGVAPALLRLYINDSTVFPANPTQFVGGQYTITIITANLRGSAGQPFCLIGNDPTQCMNPVEVTYSFTVGGDTFPPASATPTAAIPQINAVTRVNDEFRLFFNENVDFQSLVGGPQNTTALDPFMSIPFPPNNLFTVTPPPPAMPFMTTFAGENIIVFYNAPPGTVIPVNYGFICYMPDPFHNPTEVRVRFVDMSLLTATDGPGVPQNYGTDGAVWTSAGLVPPTNSAGLTLSVPPILPVPGSNNAGQATIQINLLSAMSTFPVTDGSTNGDGVLGFTDRARNPLPADIVINYTVQTGPVIANNPSPPDLHIAVAGNKLIPVSGGRMTLNATPIANGDILTGLLSLPPVILDDPSVLANAVDVEFGRFINAGNPNNFIHNAPRRLMIPLPVSSNGGDPAIPFPEGGQPENCLCYLIGLCMPPPNPQCPIPPLGVYLYVIDSITEQVKVFDSNTFVLLTTLNGVASPAGLGISPDASSLYISNFDQGTVQRYGTEPLQTLTFHQLINTIPVGPNPQAVSVNPANEDVLVANRGNNTLSFIDVPSQTERAVFPVGSGPSDIFVTDRFVCMGCTLAYMAFITNFFDDSVSVYESDTPNPQVMNGPQGRMIDELTGFSAPKFGCWNRWSNIGFAPAFMGAYIANSAGTTVDQVGAINFGLSPPLGFQGPPGFRTFSTIASYGTNTITGAPGDATIENMSALSVPPLVGDNKILARADLGPGQGIPSVLIVTYPGAGQIAAYEISTTALFGSVPSPGVALYSYYDQ